MAENNFMRFIPPRMRGPLKDLGIFGRVAADNIIGLDDDYESTGEMLGTAFREDPVGLAKDLGTGIYEGAKSIYDDPGGAYDAFTTSLAETIDRLNTPYDQLDLSTEEAQRQRAGDLMIFGEALGAGGVLTKGLVNLGKKQLREKVIQENPGLNADQVNSIVEDGGGALSIDAGIDFDAIDQMNDFSEIDPQVIVGETGYNPRDRYEVDDVEYEEIDLDDGRRSRALPIVTAGDRVIGTANPNRVDEDDLFAGFDGPPDNAELIADQNAYFESLLDYEARFDPAGNELTDDADIIDRAIQIHSEEGFPDLDPDRERLIREELDRVLDAQRAFDENNPPEIEDLMEPRIVDEDELNYNPDAYVVEVRGAVQQYLDDNNISLVDARDRLSRNQLGDSFPSDLAAFVGEQGITTPGYLTLSSALRQLEDSVTPFGLNAEDVPDDLYDRLRDIALEEPITEQQANDVRNLVTQTLNINANTDMELGGGAFDDTVDQINQLLDGQPLEFTNQQGQVNTWLTAPGYERFAPDPTDDSPNFSTDAELAAGDIGLTSENSYLTSRLDKAIADLSQTQTKFASLEQLVNTLMNKYGVQLTELQARNIPTDKIEADLRDGYSAQMFSGDKIDLKALIATGQLEDPFVVRTLGGADVAYATNFTRGVTNYKETIIGLKFPEIYNAGVKDPDHFMRHQEKIGGPTVVHIRTGEFPVALTADEMAGTTRQKAFHLGEIQSQVERVHRDSRRSRNLVLAFEDKVLNIDKLSRETNRNLSYIGPGVGARGFEADKVAGDSIKRIELLRKVDRLIANGAARENAAPGMKRLLDEADNELAKINSFYNLYDSDTGELVRPGGEVLTSFENEFRDMLVDTKMERFGKFERGTNIATPDLMQKVLDYANEVNIDDVGVGSIYQTDRITRMGIKEALQQAVDTDAEFFTLGTGKMAKEMTFGKESGQKEYYDQIVPKTFNKIMEQLEKQNDVKLPRLEKRKIETLTQDGDNVIEQEVLGIELTEDLRNLFRSKKVEAFKEGGLATLSSSLRPKLRPGTQLRRPKLRPGTLESLKEQIERDKQTKEFADFEYRADMQPQLSYNPIARLGYDPDKHKIVNTQGIMDLYGTAMYIGRLGGGERSVKNLMSAGLSRKDAERVKEDDIITSPNLSFSPVISHEFTHRGFNLLRKERNKDPEAFDEKYGKDAGRILEYTKHKYPGGVGESTEEYYVEMFDDLNSRFNTYSQRIDEDYEDFPKNTMRGTVQSSFAGPTKPLKDYSPEADDERFEQIRAFQDKVLNLRGMDKGILGLMDAAQDILTERGEPPKTKPRLKEENLNFFQKIGKAVGLKDGGLAILAKEVL